MVNFEIRQKISMLGFKHYEVAREAGITPSMLSVWLRDELSDDQHNRIMVAIENLKEKKKELLCNHG